jgi:hypothetical protein
MALQTITLLLDDMTAGDYLAYVRDADPPAIGYGLRSVSVHADPLGDTVTAVLDWARTPPPFQRMATAAGLPLGDGIRLASERVAPVPLRAAA